MTSLEAISFAVSKRKYLHKYISEQHEVNTSLQRGKGKCSYNVQLRKKKLTHHVALALS
jgi:hypothetical protein